MKISEGGRGRGGPFERMNHAQLIQGFSDQTKVADAQKQSHLVKFGWKFNSAYKNNVLAT